ncbi:hypothetical protein POG19_20420, partial [Flavonifractor plautii]|nr:hypothetical protein [Flavonifractor plautii]
SCLYFALCVVLFSGLWDGLLKGITTFNKIIEQDAEGARQCMEEHMQDVRDNLNATMQIEIPKVHNELSNEV